LRVLLVEDNAPLREALAKRLRSDGFAVDEAGDGKEGLWLAVENPYSLVVLDLTLPGIDGIEVLQRIRQSKRNVSVLITTARDSITERIVGLDAGADDYLTKPIKPKIIVSKVKALLRRLKNEEPTQEKIQIGKLIIDREQYEVTHMGKPFSMPRKEFELLYLLASKPDKVIKREKIMEIVWGSEVVVGDRTIDVHIRKLREKIGDKYFKTVKGVGYKFINSSK